MSVELAEELIAICRHFGVFEREQICCGTVTVPQCVVMQHLLAGERDVSELAAYSGVTPGAMTRLLDGLEKRKVIARGRAGTDRRRVVVKLTASGERQARRLRAETERVIGVLFAAIPEGKRAQVIESTRLMRQAMDAIAGQLRACCG